MLAERLLQKWQYRLAHMRLAGAKAQTGNVVEQQYRAIDSGRENGLILRQKARGCMECPFIVLLCGV